MYFLKVQLLTNLNTPAILPSHSTPGYVAKRNKNICPGEFSQRLCNSPEVETTQMTGDWINKLRYVYTVEYYSAIKKECAIDTYNGG